MPDPVRQVLSLAACSVAPSARVVSARGMRAGGNPWLLRLADADGTDEVVLKTGDVTTDLDRRQLITTVAALELAADHALPAPRLIAADLDGSAAGTMAVLMTVLPGSSRIPRVASAARLRALGGAAARCSALRWHRGQDWSYGPRPVLRGLRWLARSQPARRSCSPWPKSGSPDRRCQTASWCSSMATCGWAIPSGLAFLQRHDRLGCRGRRITGNRPGHPALDVALFFGSSALDSLHDASGPARRSGEVLRMAASGRPSGRPRPVLGRGSSPVHGGRHGQLPAG